MQLQLFLKISLVFITINPAMAIGYFYNCRSLMALANRHMPDRLEVVDLSAAGRVDYDPQQAHVGDRNAYFSFDAGVNPAVLETQLHQTIDAIAQHTLDNSFDPQPLEQQPELRLMIEKFKTFATLWVIAYTDPVTGGLKIGDKRLESSAQFAELEGLAFQELNDSTPANQRFRANKFNALLPIPDFTVGGDTTGWSLKVTPHNFDEGYQITVINRDPNLDQDPSHPNNIFTQHLATQIFGQPAKSLVPTVAYTFPHHGGPRDTKFRDVLSTIKDLNEESHGGVQVKGLAQALAGGINFRMFLLLAHRYQLAQTISPRAATEFINAHPEALPHVTAEADGTYPFTSNAYLLSQLFNERTRNTYSNLEKNTDSETRLFGWAQFAEMAEALTANFDESAWNRAVNGIRAEGQVVIPGSYHRILDFNRSTISAAGGNNFLFGDRVNIRSLSLKHPFELAMFENQLPVGDLDVRNITTTLQPTPAGIERGDLTDEHLKLLVARFAEQLRIHSAQD